MKKTIKDFSLDFKTVILRCDLNVTIKDNKIVITGKKQGTGKVKVISEATRN